MISFQEAQNIISSRAKDFGSETVNTEEAFRRILSEDIESDRDYPPFNRSAMDGYAIRYEDWLKNHRNFRIAEVIFAGETPNTSLTEGQCFKIMTGAAVPASADTVIRREETEETTGHVFIQAEKVQQFQNIAKQGEDLRAGEIAIHKNSLCTPNIVSILASLGKTSIKVKKLPKVAFFTTGNEVKPISAAVSATQIRNSNEWLVKSLLKQWNIQPSLYAHIPDDKNLLLNTIQEGLKHDVIILSGGVSAGDADFIPETLEKLGVRKLFHKVAIKPGKPFWCGETPEGTMVFALPGNPFSTMVTFKLFVETYFAKSLLHNVSKTLSLPFSGNRTRKSSFDEFFPVTISGTPSQIEPTAINGSGDIRLGLYAEAIAHHPKENPELSPGIILNCFTL